MVEGYDHALGGHCSRATPNTKLYLGSSWNKPFHTLLEGEGRAEGMKLFCCEQQVAAQGKSFLPRTSGTSGIWLSVHCSVSAPNMQLIRLHFSLPIF